MKELKEYFTIWSEKLSLSIEDIEKEFNNILEEEKSLHPNLTDNDRSQRALQRLALMYKRQMRSPAVGFEGIIIGASDVIDMVAKRRANAMEEWLLNPQEAIEKGLVDEKGTPLDTIQTFSTGRQNPQFGKPLPENSYSRNIIGIAVKVKDKEKKPKLFSLALRGNNAKELNLPMFKPIKFSAIDKTPEGIDNKYNLNASTFTKFDVDEKIEMPPIKQIILNHCKDMIVPLSELENYHQQNIDNYDRVAIVQGGVSSLSLEKTGFGSRVMNIDDTDNLEDIESKGLTCWLPEHIDIDFAEQSKVYVIGRTNQGKKKDENGLPTEELGDVSMNVYGVYAIPEFKINLPEDIEEITEENAV